MGFALNILALLLVLGLCWFAMVFLTGRFHGHRGVDEPTGFGDADAPEPASRDFPRSDADGRDLMTGLPVASPAADACPACEGVGATQSRGRLMPCPRCEGTGVA